MDKLREIIDSYNDKTLQLRNVLNLLEREMRYTNSNQDAYDVKVSNAIAQSKCFYGKDPLDIIVENERNEALARNFHIIMEHMPKRYGQLLWMYVVEGLSVK